MKRKILRTLAEWTQEKGRKPLILRGARQVGKSFLARECARLHFKNLVEFNFEQDPHLEDLFTSLKPQTILDLLSVHTGAEITPGKTLLFLDEIQVAPRAFLSLRYFFEQMPDLHVIAAGSLLDWKLKDEEFSVPVGRVSYLYVEPMVFSEYLEATGEQKLAQFLHRLTLKTTIPETIHQKLLTLLRRYLFTGGMPEVIQAQLNGATPLQMVRLQKSLLTTYTEDFNKYAKRTDIARIQKSFKKIPELVGQKFKYSKVDPEERSKDLKRSLEFLCGAKLATKIESASGFRPPLAASVDDLHFKLLFLDCGLYMAAHGLSLIDLEHAPDLLLLNDGALAEQFIGQHLRALNDPYAEPRLYYWERDKLNSKAEVDYLCEFRTSKGLEIIPIEFKSVKKGHLKSLKVFQAEFAPSVSVRLNSALPEFSPAKKGDSLNLLSLPLYLLEELPRLVIEEI